MKLIIAGSRTLSVTPDFIDSTIKLFDLRPIEIISGGARGIDESAVKFVEKLNNPECGVSFYYPGYKQLEPNTLPSTNQIFKLTVMHADWKTYERAAGPVRNKQMAEYGDSLLLIWDGESRGSANMKREMLNLGKPVHEIIIHTTVVNK